MKTLYGAIVVLCLSLILYSCSGNSFINLKTLKENLKLKDFPVQKDYPESDALVLTELHDVNLKIDSNYDLETIEKVQKAVKLFKNIDNYASVELSFLDDDKIMDLKARTIKPDGTVVELKSDDFHTVLVKDANNGISSDEKTIKFTFPSIEKNCIIEYDYIVEKFYPFVTDVWHIQSSIPKLQNDYRLTVPEILLGTKATGGAGWSWKYKQYNCILPEPEFQKNNNPTGATIDNSVSFMWEMKDIPGFESEPMMPPASEYLQYVKFAPSDWEEWKDISGWFYKHFYKPKLIVTDQVSGKAKELTKNCSSEIEKIKAVYNFVDSLRYIDQEMGESGFEPAFPQEVLEHKYGDCKDKGILLSAMLKSLDIKSKPVLVLTSDKGYLQNNFPNWSFNHMIVKASAKDGKDFWLDATADHYPAGILPYRCENIDALVLNDDGTSQLERTPSSASTDNVENIKLKVDLSGKDSTTFDIQISYKGKENYNHRSQFFDKTGTEMLKYCKSLVADNYLNAVVSDYSLSNIDSLNDDLKLRFNFKAPNIIEKQGEYLLLNINPFQFFNLPDLAGKEERKYDIEFKYPYTINKSVEIILPENKYDLKNLPSDFAAFEKGLCYSKEYKVKNGNTIVTTESLAVIDKDIESRYFQYVKEFFEKIKSKTNEKIIISSK